MVAEALTHASFFSGAGGLDLGLERAGWRTVSFSEIDPYASAVLAQRWPGVPNLGNITELRTVGESIHGPTGVVSRDAGRATLWTGGFPCQDLSVAGKRRGMGAGTRSGLAYAYLDLVGRHRPRFVLLENVPGLLSSHGGRDMAALIGALVELGYGVGYRVLDARYFGVPQRRRRVFILGDSTGGRAGAERASEVLSVGSRCRRHPPTGVEAGERTSGVLADGATTARTVQSAFGHHGWTLGAQDVDGGYLQVANTIRVGASGPGSGGSGHALPVVVAEAPDDAGGQGRRRQGTADLRGHEPDAGHLGDADPVRRSERPSPDARGDGAPDGLAGRSHDRGGVVWQGHGSNVGPFGAVRAGNGNSGGGVPFTTAAEVGLDDPLLPLGLDSHRYRCCGNGVVADVGEWIGRRLMEALSRLVG